MCVLSWSSGGLPSRQRVSNRETYIAVRGDLAWTAFTHGGAMVMPSDANDNVPLSAGTTDGTLRLFIDFATLLRYIRP